MRKTASDMLTPDEIKSFLSACRSIRDKAIFTVMYERGLRIGEIGSLTWRQLVFDQDGVVLNIDFKTGRPRYIRLVMTKEPLLRWKDIYPFNAEDGGNLVFLNRYREPMTHAAITKQMRAIAADAGITKHITAHLFRHSRITHLIREGMPSQVVGMMRWGNSTAKELSTYLHLTGADVDREVMKLYGIEDQSTKPKKVEALQCEICKRIYPPDAKYCTYCGVSLTKEARLSLAATKTGLATDEDIQEGKILRTIQKAKEMGLI